MDQHESDNNLHILMDKPHKLNVHKTFLCRLGRLIKSLLNCVPYVLTCQRALRATCLRADASYVLTCSCANMLCVLTYSCVNVLCMPKCLRAITSNNKNKFSMTVLLRFLVLFVSFFFWEIKLFIKSIYNKQECLWKYLLWEFSTAFRHFPYQA